MTSIEQEHYLGIRIQEAHSLIIRYPLFEELTKMIANCMTSSQSAREPQCAALDGKTGAGKSTIALELAKKYPRQDTGTHDVVTVLYLLVKAPTTAVGLVSSLLDALGDPLAYRGMRYERIDRLVKWLKKCEVRLVILDDFHHLIDSNTGKVLKDVANCLKGIIKDSGVPFLVIGIETKVDIILESDGTGELSRLFAERRTLHPFTFDTNEPETLQNFEKLITYAEKVLKMPIVVPMQRVELLFYIHYATDGFIANIMNLLHYAHQESLSAAYSAIKLENLAAAFDARLAKHVKKPNPFKNLVTNVTNDESDTNGT